MVTYFNLRLSEKVPANGRPSRRGGPEKAPRRIEVSRLAFELADEWCRQSDECGFNAAEVTP
jgi:hypothetical protein